jgi:hypothetical protein
VRGVSRKGAVRAGRSLIRSEWSCAGGRGVDVVVRTTLGMMSNWGLSNEVCWSRGCHSAIRRPLLLPLRRVKRATIIGGWKLSHRDFILLLIGVP